VIPRRVPLGLLFVTTGTLHFLAPDAYARTIPDLLPAHEALVYLSGIAELAGGAAVLHPRTARAGGLWLVATLVAVFPANVNMALHPEDWPDVAPALLWARLPLQGALIAWADWATRPRRSR